MLGAETTATAATLKELFTDARAQTTKTKRNETKRTQKDDDDDADYDDDDGDDVDNAAAAMRRPPLTLAGTQSAEQKQRRERQDFALCERERAQTKTNKANEKQQQKNLQKRQLGGVRVCASLYEYVCVHVLMCMCCVWRGSAWHGIRSMCLYLLLLLLV